MTDMPLTTRSRDRYFGRFATFLLAIVITATGSTVRGEESSEPSRGELLERAHSRIKQVYSDLENEKPEQALLRIDELGELLPEGERLVLQGRALLQLGDHRLARRKIEAAVKLRPQYGEYHYWLGVAFQRGAAHSLAIESFRKADLKGVASADLHVAWAKSLLATEDAIKGIAREQFDAAEAESFEPGTLVKTGVLVVCVFPDDHEWVVAPKSSALYHAEKATTIDTENGEGWLTTGLAWASAGFHEPAVKRFEKAESKLKDSRLAYCHAQWAESLCTMGDFGGYIDHAKQCVRAGDGHTMIDLSEAYDRAAKGHSLLGQSADAIKCLKFACELTPTVERHLRLADALMQTARPDEAAARLKDAMKLDPTRKQKRMIRDRLVETMRFSSVSR